MDVQGKATRIELFNVRTPQMRAFHMAWLAFLLCFFAWFGLAPLMPIIREELQLTQAQIGNTIIASVSITILARLLIGWLCDRLGPRLTYSGLLLVSALPVMGIGLANSYESFLLFRLAIGIVGASFVITQYHTSVMFAPNTVGTANAITAGWGNMGGGVTQFSMPLLLGLFGSLGMSVFWSWRLCMIVAGVLCLITGLAYYRLTQDTPNGNYAQLRREGRMPPPRATKGGFLAACRDYRVWALFLVYAACFGIEITMHNVAALYFTDYFDLGLKQAGIVASLFGLMNLFARALGGYLGDRAGQRWGLRGRTRWLFVVLVCQGLAMVLFSRMTMLLPAIIALLLFGLFVDMACGATFAVVPFVNRNALGSVSGIVGAGGNAGALAAGFLFKGALSWDSALLILGVLVLLSSASALLVRFSPQDELAAGGARTSPVPETAGATA